MDDFIGERICGMKLKEDLLPRGDIFNLKSSRKIRMLLDIKTYRCSDVSLRILERVSQWLKIKKKERQYKRNNISKNWLFWIGK